MKSLGIVTALLICASSTASAQDFLDRVDEALTFSGFNNNIRARVSGTLDLEAYAFDGPAPGLILTTSDALFNPRLSLFVDAQFGPAIYVFTQTRVDRGFDPGDRGAQIRLDEYAVRVSPWSIHSPGRSVRDRGRQLGAASSFMGQPLYKRAVAVREHHRHRG
jgi:hypothetical protein